MKRLILATLALAVPACGDDEVIPEQPDARAGADAGADPDAMVEPTSTALAVGAVYNQGGIASTIVIPDLTVNDNVLAGVASDDPAIRWFDDRAYIINRFGHDNVVIIDTETETLVAQISTGAGSNPQDVAVKGDTLYVPALGTAGVVVLDATDPDAGPQKTIDLSALDPTDDLPDCGSAWVDGDRLLVACSLLDATFAPQGGVIAVIDTTDDSLVDTIELVNDNPSGWLVMMPAGAPFAGELLVQTVPDVTGDLTVGCLERVTLGATPASGGCAVQSSAMGGFASGYAATGDALWLAITRSFGSDYALLRYQDDTLGETSLAGASQQPTSLAACPTGEMVVGDAAGGMRVYAADGTELTDELLDLGLPPAFSNAAVCY